MSTVSARPDDLQGFVARSLQRVVLASSAANTSAVQESAASGCGQYAPRVGAIGSVTNWVDGAGSANESWVDTIRAELLAADNRGPAGSYTTATADIDEELKKGGLGAEPELDPVPATTVIGIPETSGFADDPVSLFNGNFVHFETDLEFPGIASSLAVGRTYNSMTTDRVGAFGAGWTSALDVGLEIAEETLRVLLADGAIAECRLPEADGPAVTLPGRVDLSLTATASGFELTELDDGSRWQYDSRGRLLRGVNGATRLVFGRDDLGRIERVDETTTGRWVHYEWSGDTDEALIAAVESSDGRRCEYAYRSNHLVGADTPAGTMRYDIVDGLMRSFVDADGVVMVVNTYDETGRVLSQRSPFGRTTTYSYQAVDVSHLPRAVEFDRRPGVRTVVRGDDGIGIAMTHDADGQLLEMIDGNGAVQRLEWDFGRLKTVWDRERNKTQYRYDLSGRVSVRTDPDDRRTEFEWDQLGRLVSRIDRAGHRTTFDYLDDLRAPTAIHAPDGTTAHLELDDRGLVTATIDADGVRTEFEYDADGQLVAVRNAAGELGRAGYDEAGHLIRTVEASGVEVTLEVDPAGRARAMSRAGVRSTCEFSPAGRPVAGSQPGDVTWRNTFDESGALIGVEDGEGSQVRFDHDACGNVISVVTPDGETIRQEFDAVNRLVEMHQPNGARSRRAYDLNGESVAVTDPTGRTWRRELDALGRTIRRIDPGGATTSFTYHPNGELASTTLADGRRWVTDIDAMGRPIAVTGPGGRRAAIEYTPAGRVAVRTSPAGRTESYEYDHAGRCVAIVTDGDRHDLSLDQQGRVVEMLDDGGRTSIEWGPHGAVASSGPSGGWTADYDPFGRLATVTDAGGVSRSFDYDRRGLLAGVHGPPGDPSGTSRIVRDVRGRVSTEHHPGGREVVYDYDRNGLLDGVTDGDVTTRLLRADSGELTGVRHPDGAGWDRVLDAAGRETRRTDADGRLMAQVDYDETGRMTRASNDDGEIGFLWDDDDLLLARIGGAAPVQVERDDDGWLVTATGADGVRNEYQRDARGRLEAIRRGDEVVALDPGDEVQRDLAGRMVADRFGRVIVYDVAGRVGEVTDAHGTTTYRYDEDSGLLATIESPAGVTRFVYDPVGRLVSSERPDCTASHDYDVAGRRTHDRFDDGRVVEYVWDHAGSLTAMIDISPTGAQRAIGVERDALGMVSRLAELDPNTAIVGDESGRDVWGARTIADGVTPTLDRIDGGVWFGDLAVFAHRSYDATTRQWLSPDPLPTVPGTPGAGSAYTYDWLDPVNHVDPSGLRPLSDEEFADWEENHNKGPLHKLADAVPWDVVAAVGVVALGAVLVVSTGGIAAAVGAGILAGAGMSAGLGLATGTLSWSSVAWGGVLGGIGGGVGAGTSAAFQGAGTATRLAAAGTSSAMVDSGGRAAMGDDITLASITTSFALGSAGEYGSTLLQRLRHSHPTPAPGAPTTSTVIPYPIAGSIRNVNPLGGSSNCVNCVIATDATLSGAPASALDVPPGVLGQPISILEEAYDTAFKPVTGPPEIERLLLDSGSGSRGVVFGSRGPDVPGHVFNAVNQNGTIRFLDGQTGRVASFDGYESLEFLVTN